MSNLKYIQQTRFNNCGSACVAMLASCYGITITPAQVNDLCKTGLWGANLKEMINAAGGIGITMRALRADNKTQAWDTIEPKPCIAHINNRFLFFNVKHFVLVHKNSNDSIVVYDPDPNKKMYSLSKQEFIKIWTGYLLTVV